MEIVRKWRDVWAVEDGSESSLTNNRGVSLFIVNIRVSPIVRGCEASGPGMDAMTACGIGRERWRFVSAPPFPRAAPVNKMTSKVRAVIQRACDRRWLRRDRHEPPVERTIIPVPQGKRGMLWAWRGQLSHLPPPAVGINGACAAGSPDIPCAEG